MDDDAPGPPPRDDLVELAAALPALGGFTRSLRRSVRRRYPLPVIPDAQVGVLRIVEHAPGIGAGAVAERLGVAPNTVSTLVGDLCRAGLLTRERDPDDRRAATLFLTPQAVEGLAVWGQVRQSVLVDVLERLTPEERSALAGALPAVRHLLAELDAS